MNSLIDLHSHILPGVDDGAQTIEDSIEMAKKAVSQGITHLMCTPHHNNGKYSNPAQQVITRVNQLQAVFGSRGYSTYFTRRTRSTDYWGTFRRHKQSRNLVY